MVVCNPSGLNQVIKLCIIHKVCDARSVFEHPQSSIKQDQDSALMAVASVLGNSQTFKDLPLVLQFNVLRA